MTLTEAEYATLAGVAAGLERINAFFIRHNFETDRMLAEQQRSLERHRHSFERREAGA